MRITTELVNGIQDCQHANVRIQPKRFGFMLTEFVMFEYFKIFYSNQQHCFASTHLSKFTSRVSQTSVRPVTMHQSGLAQLTK